MFRRKEIENLMKDHEERLNKLEEKMSEVITTLFGYDNYRYAYKAPSSCSIVYQVRTLLKDVEVNRELTHMIKNELGFELEETAGVRLVKKHKQQEKVNG